MSGKTKDSRTTGELAKPRKLRPANRDVGQPHLLRRQDMRFYFGLPRDGDYGFHRSQATTLRGTNFQAGLVHLPVAQACPTHDAPVQHIAYLLEGRIEYAFEDGAYVLEPHDMLYVPAHVLYQYRNVGVVDALFLNIIGLLPHPDGKAPEMRYEFDRDLSR